MEEAELQCFTVPILLVLVISLLLLIGRRQRRILRLPPSPVGLPIIGHLHLLSQIPHQSFHTLSQRHGDLLHLRLGSVPCLVASSASSAREILRTQELAFSDRLQFKIASYFAYGGSGFVFAPYGPYWRFMKKLCMSAFLGGRMLDLFLPIRRDELIALAQSLYDKSKEGRTTVDVSGELSRFVNNVISRMTMSRRSSKSEGESEEIRKMVDEMIDLMGKFNLADYIGIFKFWDLQGLDKRMEDVRRQFDNMMETILKEKEASKGKLGDGIKDFLDILMDTSKDSCAEVKLTKENIKAFVFDVFAGGTSSSVTAMEWALAELINHPNILQKARDEIDMVVGKKRLVAESDVPNLPYLQAVIKESLRLHPVFPLIIRKSIRESKIKGYDVPANTAVFINTWTIGRDPAQWSEPLEFRPERFTEEGRKTVDFRGQHFELIPFGSGRRACPGSFLALQLLQSALGMMIQCFDWGADGGETVDMAEGLGMTLARGRALLCTLAPRLNPLPLE
ncbi:cytochrome P450 93A3-like [Zingiber officinale]|uniref:Uncharacterized protein n=1 Tax=Zingiber officinale TaxID=94328 RepID=A0A8J5IGZ8_ZINOF|nr:cytochrome P450 93A3-like [Zingiber officinale]KAG6533854.1 hypothetical protein ZIOFF_007732 [Zingiber officinale]